MALGSALNMNKDIMRGLFSGCNSLWMLGLETSNIQRQRMVKLMKIDDIRRMDMMS